MLSNSGKHFSRPADAMRAGMAPPMAKDDGDPGDEDQGQSIEVRKKPDGSFCTVEDGQEVEHPDMQSALAAVSMKLDPEEGAGDASMGAEEQGEEY